MLKNINGRLAVSHCELVDKSVKGTELGDGIITHNQYRYLNRRKKFELAQANAPGQSAFYFYDTLPEDVKAELSKKYPGGIYKVAQSNYIEKFYYYDDAAYHYYFNHELGFKESQIKRYTANASVVQAVIRCLNDRSFYQRSLGNPGRRTLNLSQIMDELEAKRTVWHHTFKSERTLRRAINRFKKEGYDGLYNRNQGNANASKTSDDKQEAVLRRICNNYNNLDNQQVADMFNHFVEVYNASVDADFWETITRQTVGNFRERHQLYVDAGSRGKGHHDNTHAMQVKRKKPSTALYFWTLDGWDVELLYQKRVMDSKGNTKVTYHNRLHVVMVLDPTCNYIVGYKVSESDTETKLSIKGALRNAVSHMRELFGDYYVPHQLQSDNFANGGMRGFYEALTETYTPISRGNAKASPSERFFLTVNKRCQLERNWSGYGMTARKEKQPNAEYLNNTAVKHGLPDRAEAIEQLERIIQEFRFKSVVNFTTSLNDTSNKLLWTEEDYLYHLGETTGYTNKLEGSGLHVTLQGMKMTFDTFEPEFRLKHRREDWVVKFDPEDKSRVLAHSETGDARFLLEEKYTQPMALQDRQEGDAEQLHKVFDFNKKQVLHINEVAQQDFEVLEEMAGGNRVLEETLSKLIITDSNGQHKINKQNAKVLAAARGVSEDYEKLERKAEEKKEKSSEERRMAYIDNKLGNFLTE